MDRRIVLSIISVIGTFNINIFTLQVCRHNPSTDKFAKLNIYSLSSDPCHPTVYEIFPTSHFGSRNEKCIKTRDSICDYYLPEKWYILQNSTLLDHCPRKGQCGVSYPAWMAGQLPAENDDIVNRTVCIMIQNDCCKEQVKIRVKNCTNYYVYYLNPMNECTSAYCIESSQPCTESEKPDITGETNKPIDSLVKDGSDIIRYVQDPKDKSTVVIACSVLAGVIALVGAGVITAIFCHRNSVKKNRRVNTDYETADPVQNEPPPDYETLHDPNKAKVVISA